LFAAIEMLEGKVIADCMPRHRHQEWIRFLAQVDEQTPEGFDIHLIADNYGTHKHHKVRGWLARHPRFHMHFIPRSISWLNVIERRAPHRQAHPPRLIYLGGGASGGHLRLPQSSQRQPQTMPLDGRSRQKHRKSWSRACCL